MSSNLINKQIQLKYLAMIKVLTEGQAKYMVCAKEATIRYSQDMFLTGADNCQNRIDLINGFLKDLEILDALTT
jgi:hypothetical protein